MKKLIKDKIYYLKKNQKLLMTSKKAGEKATFECVSDNMNSLILGNWVNEEFNFTKPSICLKRHEFFQVFTDKA
jgi:hypothetical protein